MVEVMEIRWKRTSQQPLEVKGQFKGELEHKGKKRSQPIFVIKGLQRNSYYSNGDKAIGIKGADTKDQVKEKFPSMFQGLENLGEEYEIKLQSDAKPFSLYTPRGIHLTQSQTGASQNGRDGSNIESGQTNRVVHRNGCDSEEVRSNRNLCGPEATEFQCPGGNTHPWMKPWPSYPGPKCSVNWTRTQANPTGRKVATVDHFHHSLWKILL